MRNELFEAQVPIGSILDRLPLGILLLDIDRRIVYMNQALEVLSGFTMEEVVGVQCSHVLRNNLCHQGCPVVQSRNTGHAITVEGNMINRHREKFPIRTTATPIEGEGGELAGFMETVEDISTLQDVSQELKQGYGFDQLLGRSPKMEELFRIIPVISRTDSSVLITGETGTGKDMLAEVIHRASDRARGSFIKINCGALPETLLESELFGYRKGAFTGAVQDKPGYIRLAHNGTLYLTEIGDLPLSLQVKLLTFLDDHVVYQLGSTKGFHADVRIVAATHRELPEMVREGRFRADLFYRLNVVRLHLPPLKERGDDIILLMDHFLKVFGGQFGKRMKGFSDSARRILTRYHYPGNVRELSNIIEYGVNISQDSIIHSEHLPTYLFDKGMQLEDRREMSVRAGQEVEESQAEEMESGSGVNWPEIERKMIVEALIKTRGRRSDAAKHLGWCRSTLWRKIKEYHIDS